MDEIWCDAHEDLNTPDSSPGKYFHGRPLRFLLEYLGNEISTKYKRIGCEDLVLLGARELDFPEQKIIEDNRIKTAGISLAESPELVLSLLKSENRWVYIHIDLDVLDPGVYRNVKCPVKDGFTIEGISSIINVIKSEKTLAGMSILENTEINAGALSVIDALIEAGLDILILVKAL